MQHRSLALDAKILWKTLGVILCGHKADLKALAEASTFASQIAEGHKSEFRELDSAEVCEQMVAP